jgi:hypothetical protein
MSSSLFLQTLLQGIERKVAEDLSALGRLVERTVSHPARGFRSVDVSGVEFFPITKPEMFRFLRQSGLEKWHTSTWLSFDHKGELESDAGMAININGPEADARLLQLTEKVWLNMSVALPPFLLEDGTTLLALRKEHLVKMLELARDITRRNPDWCAAQAESAMRRVIEDAGFNGKSNKHRFGGTQGSRP